MATFTAAARRYSGLSIWPEQVRGTLFPLILTLIVLGLVAAPVVVLVIASFRPAGQLPFTGKVWTIDTYAEILGSASTYRLLKNTLLYAAGAMAVSLPLAFALAWLTERTDLPGRRLLYTLMFVPMLLPPFAIALGWILLSGPNAGTLNVSIRTSPLSGHHTRPAQHLYHVGHGVRLRHPGDPLHVVTPAGPV